MSNTSQSTDSPLLNNRYRLEESLGSGGMAVVYRAYDQMLERTVAVKLLREDFSADEAFRERFHQEAKAAANLSHPNIVTVHDFGLDAGRLFIVMEYLPGTDLKSMLHKYGRLEIKEAVALMVQACAGVGYAHRAGLVHCDIKPHNMLVSPDRRLKVTDFGIARALSAIQQDETNVVWGSPQYFSPEQATGGPPSPASDVYSLGVVLYEMLTGQLPFTATSATELARLHREIPPTPPRRYNPSISPKLEQILLKVLAKEPSARYRTADQLGRVLMTLNNTADRTSARPARRVASRPVLTQEPPRPSFNRQPSSNLYTPAQPAYPRETTIEYPAVEENPLDIDWVTWGLGLLTLLFVGGLVPFWLWIYFLYNPPAH